MPILFTYNLSIGLPGTTREVDFEIDESELEGLTDKQRQERINELAYEDARQYVEVYISKEHS